MRRFGASFLGWADGCDDGLTGRVDPDSNRWPAGVVRIPTHPGPHLKGSVKAAASANKLALRHDGADSYRPFRPVCPREGLDFFGRRSGNASGPSSQSPCGDRNDCSDDNKPLRPNDHARPLHPPRILSHASRLSIRRLAHVQRQRSSGSREPPTILPRGGSRQPPTESGRPPAENVNTFGPFRLFVLAKAMWTDVIDQGDRKLAATGEPGAPPGAARGPSRTEPRSREGTESPTEPKDGSCTRALRGRSARARKDSPMGMVGGQVSACEPGGIRTGRGPQRQPPEEAPAGAGSGRALSRSGSTRGGEWAR